MSDENDAADSEKLDFNKRAADDPEIESELLEAFPDVTEQEILFIRLIQSGKSAVRAYMTAFPERLHGETEPSSRLYVAAHRLRASPRIDQWLKTTRLLAMEQYIYEDMSQHIAHLTRLREIAIEHHQIAAAVAAQKHIGMACGFYGDRGVPVSSVERASTGELFKIVQEKYPDLAQACRELFAYESKLGPGDPSKN